MINEEGGADLSANTPETNDSKNTPSINRIAARPGVTGFKPAGRNATSASAWEGGGDDGGAGSRRVLFVNGVSETEFDQPEEPPSFETLERFMPARHRLHWRMTAFALLRIAGVEKRSFAEGAAELGCTGPGLHKAYRTTLERLRLLKTHEAASVLAKQSREAA